MSKTIGIYILMCNMVLALAACTTVDDPTPMPDTQGVALAFASKLKAETRAQSPLADYYDSFIVKTRKTKSDDTGETVMERYTVNYADDKWQYEGVTGTDGQTQYLKFWDLDAKSYTFAAVSPKPDNSESAAFPYKETTVEIADDGKISINNIKGNMSWDNSANSAQAPDWMIARTIRTKSDMTDRDDIDPNKADPALCVKLHGDGTTNSIQQFHDEVPLQFHHIFAKVDFKAYATGLVTLSQFKVLIPEENTDSIINRGNYDTDTEAHWTVTASDENYYQNPKRFADYTFLEGGKTLGTDSENPILLASHIEVPQSWAVLGKREFEVTCVATDGKTYTGTITLDETTHESLSWDEGKHYTYILKINAEGTDNVILFAVDMETWKWKEGSEIEDEEHNW